MAYFIFLTSILPTLKCGVAKSSVGFITSNLTINFNWHFQNICAESQCKRWKTQMMASRKLRSHTLRYPVLSSSILIEPCDSGAMILKALYLRLICPAMTNSCLRECSLPFYRKGRPWHGAEEYKCIFTIMSHPSSHVQNWVWKARTLSVYHWPCATRLRSNQ